MNTKTKIVFTKMHGIGNDFVVIDARQDIDALLTTKTLQFIADRHFGIGCDQILLVENTQHPTAEFRYRIFNADGHEVEQCGNGARCFARYVYEKGLTQNTHIQVETKAGIITLAIKPDNNVMVDMGIPVFQPQNIPIMAEQIQDYYTIEIAGEEIQFYAVSMGNPHAILTVKNLEFAPVETLGKQIQQHSFFPQQVNVGFMQIIDENHIKLRVFERGVGETLACGTGACAAAVSGIVAGKLQSPVNVELPGGNLSIIWQDTSTPVLMTGSATFVFEGVITI